MSSSPLLLSNPKLLSTSAYLNGQWRPAISGRVYPVVNPATGETLAAVPDMAPDDTQLAIAAADAAFPAWSRTTAAYRAELLKRWHRLLLKNEADLARLLTAEQGKPLAEALGEIRYGASFIEWFAEEARRAYGDVVPAQEADKRILVLRQPVGVAGIITPWNFPNAMLARKMAPALAAGCTLVIKPAEATPLSALAMVALAEEAGFPAGVVNIVTTRNPAPIGEALTADKRVKKISFTGSTRIGKWLMEKAAAQLKRLSLELGGNAPFIVFDDADLDAAVAGAIASKYRNAGQTCVCANRIYVQAGIAEAFLAKFTTAVRQLRVGPGHEPGVDIGPLINEAAVEKVESLMHDALSRGASLALGGSRITAGSLFFEPTILTGMTADMQMAQEEVFGPVAPVFIFSTEAEAIRLANATDYGLAAYFYGRDLSRVFRVAEALAYGMVGVNTGLISTAVAPFGGIKESGFGREGSRYGMDEYTYLKYVNIGLDAG